MSIGCTAYGDRIASSKMRKKSHSTRWAYRTTIYGCTTIRACSICPSNLFDPYACVSARALSATNDKSRTWKLTVQCCTFFLFVPFLSFPIHLSARRLTLVLSCAMKFESYPHDTQVCSMMIESCKWPARTMGDAMHSILIYFVLPRIPSVAYLARFSIHLEHDRSVGRERRHWVAATRHFENFHHRLHHRVFHGQFHLLGRCIQFATSHWLPFIPHVHSIGTDCGHVMDIILDKARSDSGTCHTRRYIVAHIGYATAATAQFRTNTFAFSFLISYLMRRSHTEYTIAAITTARVLCEGRRCMDVIVFGVCIFVADGICRGQQLHGTGGDESDERILRGEYSANESNEFGQQWKRYRRRSKGTQIQCAAAFQTHGDCKKAINVSPISLSLQLSIDHRPSLAPQYDTFCNGRATALYIDKFSRFFFPFSFVILNILYWTTFL